MTEEEAFTFGKKRGVQDVELAILRQYETALKSGDVTRLADLKTAVAIVRELFGDQL